MTLCAFVVFFALLSLSSAVPYQYANQQQQDCNGIFNLGGISFLSACVDGPDSTCFTLTMSPDNSSFVNTGTYCYDSTQGLAQAARDALPYQYARQQYLQCKFLYDLGGIGTIVFCVDDPDDTCVILRMSLPNNSLVRNVGTSCLDSTQGLAHAARDAVPYQYARQQERTCKSIHNLGGLDTIAVCVEAPDSKCVTLELGLPNCDTAEIIGGEYCYDTADQLAHANLDAYYSAQPKPNCDFIDDLGGLGTIMVCEDLQVSRCVHLYLTNYGSRLIQHTGPLCYPARPDGGC